MSAQVAQVVTSEPAASRHRVHLLDTPIDRVPMDELNIWLQAFLESGTSHQVITANLDFLAIARKRPAFADVIAAADLVLCDGKPLQWAARLQGVPLPSRITGMDLVVHTAQLSAQHGYKIFFLGAAPGVAELASERLCEWIPGVQIVGNYAPPSGPFDAAEEAMILEKIRACRPDALFVALGAPRQDEWLYAHLDELDVPLCAGIGAVLDFLSGRIRRAPRWMQQAGLEWAFRMMLEPSRLWRRYMLNDLPVFGTLLAQQIRQRIQSPARRTRLASVEETLAELSGDLDVLSAETSRSVAVQASALRAAPAPSVPQQSGFPNLNRQLEMAPISSVLHEAAQ